MDVPIRGRVCMHLLHPSHTVSLQIPIHRACIPCQRTKFTLIKRGAMGHNNGLKVKCLSRTNLLTNLKHQKKRPHPLKIPPCSR